MPRSVPPTTKREALARRGLHALHRSPPSLERDQQELGLRFMLGVAVMANKGFAAAEVKEVSEAALALCGRAETSSQAFRIQWLLFLFHYFRGQLRPAEEIARELLKLSETMGDPFFVFEAHRASGAHLLDQGHFNEALEHLEQVSALYDPKRRHESMTGQSPRVSPNEVCASVGAGFRMPAGGLRGGVARRRVLARGEPGDASHFAAHLYQPRDEPAAAQERAETVIGIAEGRAPPGTPSGARIAVGRTLGEIEEGIESRGAASPCRKQPARRPGDPITRPVAQARQLERVDAAVAKLRTLALIETTGTGAPSQPIHGESDPAGRRQRRPAGCARRRYRRPSRTPKTVLAIDGYRP